MLSFLKTLQINDRFQKIKGVSASSGQIQLSRDQSQLVKSKSKISNCQKILLINKLMSVQNKKKR